MSDLPDADKVLANAIVYLIEGQELYEASILLLSKIELIVWDNEYVSLPLMQESVRQYRSSLAPVFFALAQKVYVEIFRVFLGKNGIFEKDRSLTPNKRSRIKLSIAAVNQLPYLVQLLMMKLSLTTGGKASTIIKTSA